MVALGIVGAVNQTTRALIDRNGSSLDQRICDAEGAFIASLQETTQKVTEALSEIPTECTTVAAHEEELLVSTYQKRSLHCLNPSQVILSKQWKSS